MLRTLLTALCDLLLRIFFRRIDSADDDRVPAKGPVMYVLNHPNGLLDPLFILCRSPRPVTFLAKAPLFSAFLVKHFVRAFECLPVYRAQDGKDTRKNKAVIEQSITLLASGKVLALFPEGISHSEPDLQPLKTGAARIALCASAAVDGHAPEPVQIVPVGIHYGQKTTFRSSALLVYGDPITAPVVELDADLRAPADAVEALNTEIDAAIRAVTLHADDFELLRLADQAERILAGARRDTGEASETDGLDPAIGDYTIKQALLRGYDQLRERDPAAVQSVIGQVRSYAAEVSMLGLPLDHPPDIPGHAIARYILEHALLLPLLLPLSLVGIVSHYPAYRLVGWLSERVAARETNSTAVLATTKLIAGFLFFPLTWILVAIVAGVVTGTLWAAGVALLLAPLSGYAALVFTERVADLIDRARGLWVLTSRAGMGPFLAERRQQLRDTIMALAAKLD